MARTLAAACAALVLALLSAPVAAAGPELVLFADHDDDDDDGVPDARAPALGAPALEHIFWLATERQPKWPLETNIVRLLSGDRPASSASGSRAKLGLQGVTAGSAVLVTSTGELPISVVEVLALDGRGERVDLARSHAAISRSLPSLLETGSPLRDRDLDALRWVFAGPITALPETVLVTSMRPDGAVLDKLPRVALAPVQCPPEVPLTSSCVSSPLVRATSDAIDRQHPESAARSLLAEVGGRITLTAFDRRAASIRVGGPRATALGPIERLRARLRVHVLRSSRGGMPAIGGDAAGARELARAEVDRASLLWGQCGIHFGLGADVDITVRDPPPAYLLALGCELGLPAGGGELRFRVGGRRVKVPLQARQSPSDVAVVVARQLEGLGLTVAVSPNPLTGPSALRTVDLLVRNADGSFAELAADGPAPLSNDPSLRVCLGEVDLADGLSHFSGADAAAGTVEERSLVKAYDDGDPTSIEVFVVPYFAGAGRIGESFIDTPGSSIQNVVILDRAAIRSGPSSSALAHELGHVLLDLPGHPDDYGVDQTSSLMDADANDATIFGPRRISIAECERALRQSGPQATLPLLEPWPLRSVKPSAR